MTSLALICAFAFAAPYVGVRQSSPDDPSIPKLQIQQFHSGELISAEFCRGGKTLMTADRDEVILWDVKTSFRIRSWKVSGVELAKVDPKDRYVAIASEMAARLYDLATGLLLHELRGHEDLVRDLDISRDGSQIATASADGKARLWSASTGKLLRTFEHPRIAGFDTPRAVQEVRFGASPDTLVTQALGTITRWNIETGKPASVLEGKGSIELSNTGEFATDFWSKNLDVIQTANGKRTRCFEGRESDSQAFWSQNDQTFGVKLKDTRVVVFSSAGKLIHTLGSPGEPLGYETAISLSPDGGLLAERSESSVRLWSLTTGKLVRENIYGKEPAAFSPDGSWLLIGPESTDTQMSIVATRPPPAWKPDPSAPPGFGEFPPVGIVDFRDQRIGAGSHDIRTIAGNFERRLLAVGLYSRVLLFDGLAGHVKSLVPHDGSVTAMKFSENGEYLVSGDAAGLITPGGSGNVVMTHTGSGEEILRLKVNGQVATLSFSSDEQRIITVANRGNIFSPESGTVEVWDAKSGLSLLKASNREILYDAMELPGRRYFTIGFGGFARVIDSKGCELLKAPAGRDNLIFALDEERRRCAILKPGNTPAIDIYDLEALKLIRTWEIRMQDRHFHLHFSKDGQRVFAESSFRTQGLGIEIGTGAPAAFEPSGRRNGAQIGPDVWASLNNGVVEISKGSSTSLATIIARYPSGTKVPADWAVIAPDGLFDSSNLEEIEGVQWVLDRRPFDPVPVETFMREAFEPGLLFKLLSGAPRKTINFSELSSLEGPRPKIWGLDFNADRLKPRLIFDIESSGPVSQIRVLRDRRVVVTIDRPESLAIGGKARFTIPIPLDQSAGLWKEVSVYAFNQEGVKGPTQVFEVSSEPPMNDARLYIVAVGVNRYLNPAWNLSFAARDAQRLVEEIRTRMSGHTSYREVVPVLLVSDESRDDATKENFRNVLGALAGVRPPNPLNGIPGTENLAPVRPHDAVLVVWSGHGFSDRSDEFFLMSSSASPAAGATLSPELKAACVSGQELSDWLSPIDSSEICIILDTCQSGRAVDSPDFKPGPFNSRGLGQLAYLKGIRVLAATQAADVALESGALSHGLLTYALVEDGLVRKAAYGKDGQLRFKDWFAYAVRRVPELYSELRNGVRKPSPRSAQLGGDASNLRTQQPVHFDYIRYPRQTPLLLR